MWRNEGFYVVQSAQNKSHRAYINPALRAHTIPHSHAPLTPHADAWTSPGEGFLPGAWNTGWEFVAIYIFRWFRRYSRFSRPRDYPGFRDPIIPINFSPRRPTEHVLATGSTPHPTTGLQSTSCMESQLSLRMFAPLPCIASFLIYHAIALPLSTRRCQWVGPSGLSR